MEQVVMHIIVTLLSGIGLKLLKISADDLGIKTYLPEIIYWLELRISGTSPIQAMSKTFYIGKKKLF